MEDDQVRNTIDVKRRPDRPNSNRFNNVVSVYIPPSSSYTEIETDERTELLKGIQSHTSCQQDGFEELYQFRCLYSGAELSSAALQRVGLSPTDSSYETRKITTISADPCTIYISLENLPYIFFLRNPEYDSKVMENQGHSVQKNDSIKGYIQLHVPRIGDLVPQEVCVHSSNPDVTILYVVGFIKSRATENLPEKQWLLAKFSLTGQHIARTAVYPYQRYSGIAVDTIDGNLLLACPKIVASPESENKKPENDLEHVTGQVCMLTPGFERRIFSVTMGNEVASYRPTYVTQESAGQCCWASVERTTHKSAAEGNEKVQSSRRLLAFPGRKPDSIDKQSPREWLHVCSWNFADLNPGRIAAFDPKRLLVIDEQAGTLSYITWNEGQDRPNLHRITRSGSKPIKLLCSSYQTTPDNGIVEPVAYLVSDSNIYSFSFRQLD